MIFQCRCLWLDERCTFTATQEDGLCDWCAGIGARTEEQLRANAAAIVDPRTGEYLGLGSNYAHHDAPLADRKASVPKACWYENSGRTFTAVPMRQFLFGEPLPLWVDTKAPADVPGEPT